MDQSRALRLAAEAFDLWQDGRLLEAEERYLGAVVDAGP
jgi:hypothetical protein